MSLKISLPGFDYTASPEHLAVDSDYDTLKLIVDHANPYFGEIKVFFSRNPPAGTYNVFTYKHRLPNTPVSYVFFDGSNSSVVGDGAGFVQSTSGQDTSTQFLLNILSSQQFKVTNTSDGFSLDYVVTDNTTLNVTGNFYSFKYFVYVNDGL